MKKEVSLPRKPVDCGGSPGAEGWNGRFGVFSSNPRGTERRSQIKKTRENEGEKKRWNFQKLFKLNRARPARRRGKGREKKIRSGSGPDSRGKKDGLIR